MSNEQGGRPATCPPWCVMTHGVHLGEEDQVHVSGQFCIRNTLIRLCSTIDPVSREQDGPYVLLGHHEYSLDEAGDLVDVLLSFISQARERRAQAPTSPRAHPAANPPRIPNPRAGS